MNIFNYRDRSISLNAEMNNPSCHLLTFDRHTYSELKENIPVFLKEVGYKFETALAEKEKMLNLRH